MENVLFVSNEELGRVYERTKLWIKIEGLVTETDALFHHVRKIKGLVTETDADALFCHVRKFRTWRNFGT